MAVIQNFVGKLLDRGDAEMIIRRWNKDVRIICLVRQRKTSKNLSRLG
jgi:hypothetical protein